MGEVMGYNVKEIERLVAENERLTAELEADWNAYKISKDG